MGRQKLLISWFFFENLSLNLLENQKRRGNLILKN